MHSSGGCFHQTMNLLPRYSEKKASQNRHFVTGVVQFIRKVSDSELTKRAILINIRTALNVILSNCTKSRNFSRRLYGDSIFSRKFKSVNYDVLQYRKRTAFKSFLFWACFADLPWGGLKKSMRSWTSGRRGIALSKLFHRRPPTFRTQADV